MELEVLGPRALIDRLFSGFLAYSSPAAIEWCAVLHPYVFVSFLAVLRFAFFFPIASAPSLAYSFALSECTRAAPPAVTAVGPCPEQVLGGRTGSASSPAIFSNGSLGGMDLTWKFVTICTKELML